MKFYNENWILKALVKEGFRNYNVEFLVALRIVVILLR